MINARCKWTQVMLHEVNSRVTIFYEDSRHVVAKQDTLHYATFVAEASELNTRHIAKY